jgi:hypothetical protein
MAMFFVFEVQPFEKDGRPGEPFLGRSYAIWGWVKTNSTPGEPQNSWDLWMFIPLKMVSIGIDP